MTNLTTIIADNFTLDAEVMAHYPTILALMALDHTQGNYDNDYGELSESSVVEAFDNYLFSMLVTRAR